MNSSSWRLSQSNELLRTQPCLFHWDRGGAAKVFQFGFGDYFTRLLSSMTHISTLTNKHPDPQVICFCAV